MPDAFEDVPFAEAVVRFRLDLDFDHRTTLWSCDTAEQAIARIEADPDMRRFMERLHSDWRAAERRKVRPPPVVRYYPTHTVVAEDFDLDGWHGRDHIAGFVVEGDLEIYGRLINTEPDTKPPFMVIRGNLHCQGLMVSGSDVIIGENVMVASCVGIPANQGLLRIGGDLTAKLVVMEHDGSLEVAGQVRASSPLHAEAGKAPLDPRELVAKVLPEFRQEFVDDRGYLRDQLAFYDALVAGRHILRGQ